MIRRTVTTLIVTAFAVVTLTTASPALAETSSAKPVASHRAASETMTVSPRQPARTGVASATALPSITGDVPSALTTADPSSAGLRFQSGPPEDSVAEDAQTIIDLASRGATVLSFEKMLVVFIVVVGLLGAFGIMVIVLGTFVLRRRST